MEKLQIKIPSTKSQLYSFMAHVMLAMVEVSWMAMLFGRQVSGI